MAPIVTVIIATLNRPTLKSSLESLRNQAISLKVIYITNRNLTNHIGDLHLSIIPNIEYEIITSDEKLYGCLNQALTGIKTEYISFLHDDDWYGDSYFDEAVYLMENHPEINWCFGDVYEIQINGLCKFRLADPYYFIGIALEPPRIWHPAGIYRKTLFNFDKVGNYRTLVSGTEIGIASDYDWFLRAEILGIRGTKLREMQYFMRWGGLSTINHALSILECVIIVSNLYPKSGLGQYWLNKYSWVFSNNMRLLGFVNKFKKFLPSLLRSNLKSKFHKILRRSL
jgi:hypothetical protein